MYIPESLLFQFSLPSIIAALHTSLLYNVLAFYNILYISDVLLNHTYMDIVAIWNLNTGCWKFQHIMFYVSIAYM